MRSCFNIPALVLFTLGLSACANTQTSPSSAATPAAAGSSAQVTPVVPGACRAEPAQYAIGRMVDGALESDVRASSGARIVRVLRPGQMVTMEFSAERLNLTVDAAGKVTRVNCG